MKLERMILCFWLVASLSIAGLASCDGSTDNGDGSTTEDGITGTDDDQSPDGATGSDTGQDGGLVGPGGLPICDVMQITAGETPPNLLLVVDKSGSMSESTGGGGGRTKLQDAQDALEMLLDEGDGKIRFGWLQYPADTACKPGAMSDSRAVECADDSVNTIKLRVNSLYASGGTPTGDTLQNANAYQGLHDEERPNYVVLLTDGMPTCPEGLGREVTEADKALALAAVQGLYAGGIETFVIGLGEDLNNSNPELLSQMAEAGGRPRAGAVKYYQANSLAELEAVLQDIGGMVIGCNLLLENEPEYPAWLWVFFCDANGDNCVAQARDTNHVNGWDYDEASNRVNFFGPMCDQLRSGTVEYIDVLMGCAPPD